MALTGQVTGDGWSVSTNSMPADGGFCCEVYVAHGGAAGEFKHQFRHSKIFAREWETVLDGLREGVVWIGLKRAETIHL
ncbi:UDP-glucose 4-epimerase [Burkholderia sp. S171]|uniref:UDP-glucose 4-epimerase n=1 Tax=Burkholderia sp. S171 TaxID=1641860 RepID=UPI00131E57F9|nr:UDP-glucose 4-epimerase [Burkholderia sp. S171]